jgi:hypothetical protein
MKKSSPLEWCCNLVIHSLHRTGTQAQKSLALCCKSQISLSPPSSDFWGAIFRGQRRPLPSISSESSHSALPPGPAMSSESAETASDGQGEGLQAPLQQRRGLPEPLARCRAAGSRVTPAVYGLGCSGSPAALQAPSPDAAYPSCYLYSCVAARHSRPPGAARAEALPSLCGTGPACSRVVTVPALPGGPGCGVRNLKMGRVYRGTISQIARYQSWRTGSYSAAAHGAVHDAHSFSYCSCSTMCCGRTQSWSHGRATVPRLQATGTTTATGTDSRPVLEAWSPSGASPRACPPVSRCRPCSSSSCRAHRPCACAVRMRPQPLCICACACAPTCAVHAHLTCAFAPQPLTHARALIAAISRRLQPLHLNAARRARDTRCLGERVSMPPECGSAGRRLP